MELAVEAVLQPPQDSLAGPSLDDSLQQLALHFLGGGMSAGARGALTPGPGEETPRKGGGLSRAQLGASHRRSFATCSLNQAPLCSPHPAHLFRTP